MGRQISSFNGEWKYTANFDPAYLEKKYDDAGFLVVNLPHANREVPYNYFDEKMYQFISCYRKSFQLSKEHAKQRVFIDFEGVMTYAKVYLNGEYLGEHKGGYTPFTFELTGKVDFEGENSLTVMVDSTERADIPPFGNVIDYLTFGGIYREVYLRVVDDLFISNVFAKPRKALESQKELELAVFLDNGGPVTQKVELEAKLSDGQRIVANVTSGFEIPAGKSSVTMVMENLKDIKLWDGENPNLYTVEVDVVIDEQMIDTYSLRTGFRQVEVTAAGFYLNGQKLMLRGLNRHQAYPYVGYAMPERAQKKDADILKYELRLNTVRTSHYPQSRHFLDRCDEIGLLVLEEIPGWQHIGDEEWKEVACQNVREMIERDWNHPSIFLWGVRINESPDDHDFYTKTNKIAHQLDDTRQTGGVRYIRNSELLEDVYTMNDFIHRGEADILRDQRANTGLDYDVPYLVTEFNGHMYPTKRFDQEERLMEHALRHLKVHNRAGEDEHIAGAIGWCAFDYNTHYDFGSGDRICYHGVMDMFRIPKFAANFYKSQADPEMEMVLEPATLWTRGERNMGGVTPLVVFTNCDKVELLVDGKTVGTYTPDYPNYQGVKFPPVIIDKLEGFWGSNWNDGEFIGYRDGKEAARKKFIKNPVAAALTARADDKLLAADREDATRVVYQLLDQVGNPVPFINEYIEFEISGPGELVGPNKTALIGGAIAVWVKSGYEKGEILLKASCSRFEANEVRIRVE